MVEALETFFVSLEILSRIMPLLSLVPIYITQALNINMIGVNTLKPAFERQETHMYKHNHVVFVGTDKQEEELRNKLLVTGLAIDVKPYKRQTRDADVHLDLGENGILKVTLHSE